MKLVNQSVELIPQDTGLEGIYKAIEIAGRISHRSEPKGNPKEFVDRLIGYKHGAALEFGTVYLKVPKHIKGINSITDFYIGNPFSKVDLLWDDYLYITTNYRVLVENNKLHHLKFIEDEKYLKLDTDFRVCFKIVTDRAISHELVRHRSFSFLQESTRYCNYSKDKYGNELTFICPTWVNKETAIDDHPDFMGLLIEAEDSYLRLLKDGWKPEQARVVLPNALKTELYMCGCLSDWDKFLKLRTASDAHPQIREIANWIKNLINDKYGNR